jgi:hypothetical protein
LIRELRDQIATRSKEEFEHGFLKEHDNSLFVMYFTKDKNKPLPLVQIGTSDINANRTPFGENTNSVIGCAFNKPDNLVGFTEKKMTSFSDCSFVYQPEKNIKSLYCYALKGLIENEPSVGICIRQDVSSKTAISVEDCRTFLSDKAREFYKLEIDLRKKISSEANLNIQNQAVSQNNGH